MKTETAAMLGAGAAVLVLGWLGARTVAQGASDAIDAVTPTNPDNVFYRGVNEVVRVLTGDPHATLGTKIYDWTHPETVAQLNQQARARGMGD